MNVAKAYIEVLNAAEAMTVAQRQVSIDSMQVVRMQGFVDNGKASVAQLAQQKATMAQSQLTVTTSRLSWLSLMVLRVRKPSKSDTVDPIVNDVLDVLLFSYVFCAVSPRPNEKFYRQGQDL